MRTAATYVSSIAASVLFVCAISGTQAAPPDFWRLLLGGVAGLFVAKLVLLHTAKP